MLSRRAILAGLATAPLLGTRAFASGRLSVVATTGMIADAARMIGGTQIEVKALMGPGVDPHSYRQTRSDIVAMTRADLLLWNGLYLEAQLEEFIHTLGKRVPVTAVAEAVPQKDLLHHADYDNRSDPHVWMTPSLWRHAVASTRDALAAARPEAAIEFSNNAETYLADLDRVDLYAREVTAKIPDTARVLITAHDAFGYFGREYGFEVKGIQGISTESEAGLQRIRSLVDEIVARKIGAVFVESSVSDRNIRALIEGAAAQGHEVKIGGELYSDAMGSPGTYEGTYVGMIDHNASVIASALGAPVPQGGMDGKLSHGV